MSDFDLLKYKVEDISSTLMQIKTQLTKSKSIVAQGDGDRPINISCGVTTVGTLLSYEVLVADGEDVIITLRLDGEVLNSTHCKMLTGEVLVRGRKLHTFSVECDGIGSTCARLRLEGAGLKIV